MAVSAAVRPRRGAAIRYYPVSLNLRGRLVVVVGGGSVAERKVNALLDCSSRVRVIALEAARGLQELALQERIELILRPYEARDVANAFLVIASTDDEELNRRVFADADSMNVPCNVVDAPELCSFIVPSVVSQGDLSIAVSTSGSSPSLSKIIRERLEGQFGPEYAEYLRILRALRSRVKRRYAKLEEREQVWSRLHASPILDAIRAGDRKRAREIVRACL